MQTLIVDVDNTLLKTDLLIECIFRSIKNNPASAFKILLLGMKNKAALKRYLAEKVPIVIHAMPYNEAVYELIQQYHTKGASVYLASASDEILVHQLLKKFPECDGAFGSNGEINLKGSNKASLLREKFGSKKFDYVGDSFADIPIWKEANHAFVVTDSSSLINAVKKVASAVTVIAKKPVRLFDILQSLRAHQWVKNILIFIPLLMAHQVHNIAALTQAFQAFLSFSLVASAVYILNDLTDLDVDRQHRRKKQRPFAAGKIPLCFGGSISVLLLVIGALLGLLVSKEFLIVLISYFLVTCMYSFFLKRITLLDIITLASLYTIRILAGSIAVQVIISQWLFAFSMFLFFSLACVKRYSELFEARAREVTKNIEGRGYHPDDLESISQFGSSSGYIAILVLALYINSKEVTALYARPELLWIICPLLFYWISRVWLLATRGQMHDDPIVFALRDRTSYVVGLVLIVSVMFAI